MLKVIQASLVFVTMVIFISVAIGQDAFDQTVAQIKALETKLEKNLQRVERGISEFQKSHKLNAPKDMFESDADYAARKSELILIVSQHRDNLEKKYLRSIQSQITHLYRRIFSTNDVTITLGPYDANNEFFSITFGFQSQHIERRFDIKKEDARKLYHNWDKVIKRGYLSIGMEYRRTLAMVKLENPVLLQEFTFEFSEVYDVSDNDSVSFNRNWKNSTQGKTFILFLNFIKMKVEDGSISPRDSKLHRFLENVIKEVRQHNLKIDDDPSLVLNVLKEWSLTKTRTGGLIRQVEFILRRLQEQIEHSKTTFSPGLLGCTFAFSPSGKYLATVHPLLNQSGIALWEVNSGTKVGQVAHGDTVNALCFSHDGHYLAIGENNKAITFYRIPKNLTFGDKITKEKVIQTSGEIKDLAWSPYGNLISDGKKVYRTLLQPEIYDIKKPVKPIISDKP